MKLIENTIFVFINLIENLQYKNNLTSTLLNKINLITNEKIKKQEIAKYNLLNNVYNSFVENRTLDMDNIKISKNGKPFINEFNFSISHSNELIAIAVSKDPIGIDIQYNKQLQNKSKFFQRLLSPSELSMQNTFKTNKQAIDLWTKKESIYKMLDNSIFFNPKDIKLCKYFTKTKKLETTLNSYFVTVACSTKKIVYYYIQF